MGGDNIYYLISSQKYAKLIYVWRSKAGIKIIDNIIGCKGRVLK